MPPAPETPLELTPEQAEIARRLSRNLQMFGGLAVLQGVLWIAVAGVLLFGKGMFGACLLPLIVGVASAITGVIAVETSTDAKYLAEYPAYNRNHLGNTVGSINDYLSVVFGVGVLLALVMAGKLFF